MWIFESVNGRRYEIRSSGMLEVRSPELLAVFDGEENYFYPVENVKRAKINSEKFADLNRYVAKHDVYVASKDGNKYSIYNAEAEVLLSDFDYIHFDEEDTVGCVKYEPGRYGFFDLSSRSRTRSFVFARPFFNGLSYASMDGREYMYVDRDLIPRIRGLKWDSSSESDFSGCGLAMVPIWISKVPTFIDMSGDVSLSLHHSLKCRPFVGNFCVIYNMATQKYGVIDADKKVILKFEYDYITRYDRGYVLEKAGESIVMNVGLTSVLFATPHKVDSFCGPYLHLKRSDGQDVVYNVNSGVEETIKTKFLGVYKHGFVYQL